MSTPDPAPTPPRQPASPEHEAAQARRHSRTLGALTLTLLGSWLAMLLPLPWSLLSGVLALVALVLVVLVVRSNWAMGRRANAAFGLIFGVPASLVLIGVSVVSLLFYGPTLEFQECMASAVTERARTTCEAGVSDSTAAWISRLLGG